MDIKDLEYYCELIKTKSYSETAKFFHVTQPTISAMQKRIEKELQAKLIYKNTRAPMHVTHAGLVTYRFAKKMISQEQMLKKDVQRAQKNNFILGYSELAGSVWLPLVINDLNQGKLLANIETYQENSELLKRRLLQGYFDAIVYSRLENEKTRGINETILGKHPFKFLVPCSHPLSQNKEIDIYQVADTPLIMRHHRYLSNLAIHKIFERTGFRPKKKLYIDNIEAMEELVQNQMGIGFVMDTELKSNEKMKVISPIFSQQIFAYTCLGIRKSFLPNEYQKKYLKILAKPINKS